MTDVLCPYCGRKMCETDRARDGAWVEYSCDNCKTQSVRLPESKRYVLKLFREST